MKIFFLICMSCLTFIFNSATASLSMNTNKHPSMKPILKPARVQLILPNIGISNLPSMTQSFESSLKTGKRLPIKPILTRANPLTLRTNKPKTNTAKILPLKAPINFNSGMAEQLVSEQLEYDNYERVSQDDEILEIVNQEEANICEQEYENEFNFLLNLKKRFKRQNQHAMIVTKTQETLRDFDSCNHKNGDGELSKAVSEKKIEGPFYLVEDLIHESKFDAHRLDDSSCCTQEDSVSVDLLDRQDVIYSLNHKFLE